MSFSGSSSSKKRILSGVQPSGIQHLGNYLGAMRNHVTMQDDFESYIFIADLHTITTIRNPTKLNQLILSLALDYLALGLDPEKTVFFRQSDVHEHAELTWIFSCVTPMNILEQAHAYKDAVAKGYKDATAGLFFYPVLMAADILIYKPDLVPPPQIYRASPVPDASRNPCPDRYAPPCKGPESRHQYLVLRSRHKSVHQNNGYWI